jgi:CDP-diacylglycerol pyrophosphatase
MVAMYKIEKANLSDHSSMYFINLQLRIPHFQILAMLRWLGLASILFFAFTPTGQSATNSDILLDIVQQCIQTDRPGYCEQCRAPQRQAVCTGKTSCQASTEVWAENSEFVAIRDIKMCGCPTDFVHGLVLPKATITGVEDDRRPEAIWPFAWQVALERIKLDEIALAVNSKSKRTQNQLHVHVARLKPGLQTKLAAFIVASTDDLNAVWHVAQLAAVERHMAEYGVLVTAAPGGGYRVALTTEKESPEGQFTQAVCIP